MWQDEVDSEQNMPVVESHVEAPQVHVVPEFIDVRSVFVHVGCAVHELPLALARQYSPAEHSDVPSQ